MIQISKGKTIVFSLIDVNISDDQGCFAQLAYLDWGKHASSLFGILLSSQFLYFELFYQDIKIFDKRPKQADDVDGEM